MSDPDNFTETTTRSWGGRIGQSLVGVVIGLLLIPAAIALIYWNEGRAAEAFSALAQGQRQVVEADAGASLPANDGKLVHLTGEIRTATPARDAAFGVTGDGLLRLRRKVEMFQWKEEKETTSQESIGGSETTTTTYSYHRVWSEDAIDSGAFRHPAGHVNPVLPMKSVTFDAPEAALGAYRIDPGVLDKISDFASFPVTQAPADYKLEDGGFYRGQDPAKPAVGDLRVSFAAVSSQVFSVVAAAEQGALAPFHAANGYQIALIKPGALSAAALFAEKKQEERILTWVLRAAGFLVMFIAFALIAAPVATLFAIVPFLEGIARAGTFLVALTFAVPLTLVTIAVAWAAHRPIVGGLLLAAAIVSLILFARLHRPKPAPAAS
ncbi:MAG TPA: TMEM43 family protein [Methylovirgula sp.]|nr:TMEM43 family protein [Methylovirgula sp.]